MSREGHLEFDIRGLTGKVDSMTPEELRKHFESIRMFDLHVLDLINNKDSKELEEEKQQPFAYLVTDGKTTMHYNDELKKYFNHPNKKGAVMWAKKEDALECIKLYDLDKHGFYVQEAYVHSVDESNHNIHFNNLCKICNITAGLICSKCNLIYYCSKEHQQADWKDHKEACKIHDIKSSITRVNFK